MLRKIVEFDRDELGDWRARLECGHYRHFRHDPPLVTRDWIMSDEGRRERLGKEIECRRCAAVDADQ